MINDKNNVFNTQNDFYNPQSNSNCILFSTPEELQVSEEASNEEIFFPEEFYSDAVKLHQKPVRPTGELQTDDFFNKIANKVNNRHFQNTGYNSPQPQQISSVPTYTPVVEKATPVSPTKTNTPSPAVTLTSTLKHNIEPAKPIPTKTTPAEEPINNTQKSTPEKDNFIPLENRINIECKQFNPNSIIPYHHEGDLYNSTHSKYIANRLIEELKTSISNKSKIDYSYCFAKISPERVLNKIDELSFLNEGLKWDQIVGVVQEDFLINSYSPTIERDSHMHNMSYSTKRNQYVEDNIKKRKDELDKLRVKGYPIDFNNILDKGTDTEPTYTEWQNGTKSILLDNAINNMANNSTTPKDSIKQDVYGKYEELSFDGSPSTVRNLVLNHKDLQDILPNVDPDIFNKIVAIMYVHDKNVEKLELDLKHNDYFTRAKCTNEFNEKILSASIPQLQEIFSNRFKNPNGLSKEEIQESILIDAYNVKLLFQKDARLAPEVMKRIYNDNLSYNFKDGVLISLLDIANTVGFDTSDRSKELKEVSEIANSKQDSEFKRWVGNFIRDNVVDIALLITGLGVGKKLVVKIPATIHGVSCDINQLTSLYHKLEDQGATTSEITWEISIEIAKMAGTKLLGKAFGKWIEKYFKNQGALDDTAKEIGSLGDGLFKTGTKETRKAHNNKNE